MHRLPTQSVSKHGANIKNTRRKKASNLIIGVYKNITKKNREMLRATVGGTVEGGGGRRPFST